MEKSKVFFTDFHVVGGETLPKKLHRLMKSAAVPGERRSPSGATGWAGTSKRNLAARVQNASTAPIVATQNAAGNQRTKILALVEWSDGVQRTRWANVSLAGSRGRMLR